MKLFVILLLLQIGIIISKVFSPQDVKESYAKETNQYKNLQLEDLDQNVTYKNDTPLQIRTNILDKLKISEEEESSDVIDWTTQNYVKFNTNATQECPSFWVFSTVSAMQSAIGLADNISVDLSEQFILSCRGQYYQDYTCEDGHYYIGMDIISYYDGLPLQETIQFEGSQKVQSDQDCQKVEIAQIDYYSYHFNYVSHLALELAFSLIKGSPGILMSIKMNDKQLYDYDPQQNGGILQCDTDASVLSVHVVGYNATGKYFIGKGPFGQDFGVDGYFAFSTDCWNGQNDLTRINVYPAKVANKNTNNENNNIKVTQELPTTFFWTQKTKLIFNTNATQDCPSFWVFSTVSAIQAAIGRTYNLSIDLSEQFILSCRSQLYADNTCKNGNYYDALHVVSAYDGLPLQETIQFEGSQKVQSDQDCQKVEVVQMDYFVLHYNYLSHLNLQLVFEIISQTPAVLMSINMYQNQLYNYDPQQNGGILQCDTDASVLSVHVVGYNATGKYFIGKGPFGQDFGVDGYFAFSTDCWNGQNNISQISVYKNQTSGNNTDGNNTYGNNTDGNNTDGNNTDGNNTDGNNTDGNNTDGNNTDGNKTDGNSTNGNSTNNNSNFEGRLMTEVLLLISVVLMLGIFI